MALAPEEMIKFYGEQAEGTRAGMVAAQSSGNLHLALLNCQEGVKCRLMKGLIAWRLGLDPSGALEEVLDAFRVDLAVVNAIGQGSVEAVDLPLERIGFVSHLLGRPFDLSLKGTLASDRLLDSVLVGWLFGHWDDDGWDLGMKELRGLGSAVAIQSYELYKLVTNATSNELQDLLDQGSVLFRRRASDKFFRGGDQAEGGGNDNPVTVDYRLASLMKRAGLVGSDHVHAWKW